MNGLYITEISAAPDSVNRPALAEQFGKGSVGCTTMYLKLLTWLMFKILFGKAPQISSHIRAELINESNQGDQQLKGG